MMTKRGWVGVLALAGFAGVVACDSAAKEEPAQTGLTTSPGDTAAATDGTGSDGAAASTTGGPDLEGTTGTSEPPSEPPVMFDFGVFPDVGEFCGAPNPVSCDDEDDDPWHAIGLNCTGGPQVEGTFFGDPQQMYVHEGNFGASDAFPPREGNKVVFLSSGIAQEWVTEVGGRSGPSWTAAASPTSPIR